MKLAVLMCFMMGTALAQELKARSEPPPDGGIGDEKPPETTGVENVKEKDLHSDLRRKHYGVHREQDGYSDHHKPGPHGGYPGPHHGPPPPVHGPFYGHHVDGPTRYGPPSYDGPAHYGSPHDGPVHYGPPPHDEGLVHYGPRPYDRPAHYGPPPSPYGESYGHKEDSYGHKEPPYGHKEPPYGLPHGPFPVPSYKPYGPGPVGHGPALYKPVGYPGGHEPHFPASPYKLEGLYDVHGQRAGGLYGPIPHYKPYKQYGGHGNYGSQEINHDLYQKHHAPINPDDLDGDGEADHLTVTKHKIDEYIAKQWLLGKRKLTVQVKYGNMPLEYQYLGQYHGFPNPVEGTPLASMFGVSSKPAESKKESPVPHYGMAGYTNSYGSNSDYGKQSSYNTPSSAPAYSTDSFKYTPPMPDYSSSGSLNGNYAKLSNYAAQSNYAPSPNYATNVQPNYATPTKPEYATQSNYALPVKQEYVMPQSYVVPSMPERSQTTYAILPKPESMPEHSQVTYAILPKPEYAVQQNYATPPKPEYAVNQNYATPPKPEYAVQQNYATPPKLEYAVNQNYATPSKPEYATQQNYATQQYAMQESNSVPNKQEYSPKPTYAVPTPINYGPASNPPASEPTNYAANIAGTYGESMASSQNNYQKYAGSS